MIVKYYGTTYTIKKNAKNEKMETLKEIVKKMRKWETFVFDFNT